MVIPWTECHVFPILFRNIWGRAVIGRIHTEMNLKILEFSKVSNHVTKATKMTNLGLLTETRHTHDSSLDILIDNSQCHSH